MQNHLTKIVGLLNDHEFHDGTTIGKQLHITRAAVWKTIKKLEQYGIRLEAGKKRGYRLKEPLILLDEKKIKSLACEKTIQMDILEKINSTNDYLKYFMDKNKTLEICLAEMQTKGKGRFNRQWHSPFGQNIYFSLLYPFKKDVSELSGLSLVLGLAVCQAIQAVCSTQSLHVKWPNDVVIGNQKISGNLIEIQAESHSVCQAILGIGINVNMKDANKKEINQSWSSLQNLTGHYYDRNILCASLINYLLKYLKRFEQKGLTDFIVEWKSKDYLLNQSVQLICNKKKFEGIGAGINEQGHLLLKLPDGKIHAFSSCDTSLLTCSTSKCEVNK